MKNLLPYGHRAVSTLNRKGAVALLLIASAAASFATGTGSAYETAMETPVTTITSDAETFLPVVLLLAIIIWGVRFLKRLFKTAS